LIGPVAVSSLSAEDEESGALLAGWITTMLSE
jgi:hypothetical protein